MACGVWMCRALNMCFASEFAEGCGAVQLEWVAKRVRVCLVVQQKIYMYEYMYPVRGTQQHPGGDACAYGENVCAHTRNQSIFA